MSTLQHLKEETTDEGLKNDCETAIENLLHTQDKEVDYALWAFERTLEKNAAKVRKTEFREKLKRTIDQLYLDLSSVIHHY